MSDFDSLLNNTNAAATSPATESPAKQRKSKEEFAAMKKAQRDDVFTLSDNTTLSVAEQPDKFRQYLDVQSKFTNYSIVNTMLIMAQFPEATRLGDFNYWQEQGAYILKGEKAMSILEPKTYTKADDTTGISYNVKKVFDISQVNRENLRIRPTPNYTERQIITALVDKAPVKIVSVAAMPDYVPEGQGAFFDYANEQILVRKGMGFEDIFKSVGQELALAQIGQQADNIPDNPQFAAYCATYMLCKRYGVDTRSFSFADAPPVFDGLDAKEVRGELSPMLNVAKDISQRMNKHLEATGKEKATKSQEAR